MIGVLIGLVVSAYVILVASELAHRRVRQELLAEKKTTLDLLNRVSARSYESYAALQPEFQAAVVVTEPPRKLYDSTGLIEIDLPDGE